MRVMKTLSMSTLHNHNHSYTTRCTIRSSPSGFLWLSLFLGLSCLSTLGESVQCTNDQECEILLRKGSECWEGSCTNPYAMGGCLKNHLPEEFKQIRTCNSQDPMNIIEDGRFCRPSDMDYMEIRIGSQNWEGAFFVVWVIQVLLSEILNVPVSVETGERDKYVNFYHIHSAMDYGLSDNVDGLKVATEIGDCRNLGEQQKNVFDNYTSCQHIIPDIWSGKKAYYDELEEDGMIETPLSQGSLGDIGWYIPRFTAKRDITVLHYLGMEGEENRRKLAEMFLRPTSWKQYCDEVSTTNCQTDDGIAARAPYSSEEGDMYHKEGAYIGHFRKTERNDCDKFPTNCTGHIVDFPCTWSSYVKQTTFHLNIALEPELNDGGHTYSQMQQIWAAADATKSNVIMQWWTPEALMETYTGTDSEFLRVTLTRPTQSCIENRVSPSARCSDSLSEQVGDQLGACDWRPHILQKALSTSLFEETVGPNIPDALHNPAYDVLKKFTISELQVNDIFGLWLAKGRDKWNFDPREATCEWIVDNLNLTKSFVPETHPRIIVRNDHPLTFQLSIMIAGLALVLCILSMYLTFRLRDRQHIKYAQLEFLSLLLFGVFLVSLGSLFIALQPVLHGCTVVIWLINLGYTLELVPLMIKIAAINRLMNAARRMQKIQLQRSSLFGGVFLVSLIACIGLTTWTVVDPPIESIDYILSDDASITPEGEYIVRTIHYCHSEREIWHLLSIGWVNLLLICGMVLAFQTRNVREEINETRTLAMMTYSHFVFVLLRSILYVLEDSLRQSGLEAIQSITYSADAIGVIVIYFLPKFLYEARRDSSSGGGRGGYHYNNNNNNNRFHHTSNTIDTLTRDTSTNNASKLSFSVKDDFPDTSKLSFSVKDDFPDTSKEVSESFKDDVPDSKRSLTDDAVED